MAGHNEEILRVGIFLTKTAITKNTIGTRVILGIVFKSRMSWFSEGVIDCPSVAVALTH